MFRGRAQSGALCVDTYSYNLIARLAVLVRPLFFHFSELIDVSVRVMDILFFMW